MSERMDLETKTTTVMVLGVQPMDLNFLDLPELVIEEIMEYLDPASLKILRLTCKRTKEWVDVLKYLQKIRIYMKDESELEEVMRESEVEWNNVSASLDLCSSPLFHQFLSSSQLKTLEIHDFGFDYDDEAQQPVFQDLSPILLHIGPALESLLFKGSFDRRKRYPPQVQLNLLGDEDKEIMRTNLFHLKHLHFNIQYYDHPNQVIHFLALFFQRSPNLETVTLPAIFLTREPQYVDVDVDVDNGVEENGMEEEGGVQGGEQDMEMELGGVDVPQPPISFPFVPWFKSLLSSGQPCPLRKIDCRARPSMDCLFWGAEEHCVSTVCMYSLTTETGLIDMLINFIGPLGVELFHVDLIELPDPVTLNDPEKALLDKCVKSVICLNDEDGVKDKYIPPGCPIHVTGGTMMSMDHSGFQLPIGLNVSSIHFSFTALMPALDDIILHTIRPSVTQLRIFQLPVSLANHSVHIPTTFPNLKRLWLGKYVHDGEEEEEALDVERLTRGLSDLEELYLVQYRLDLTPPALFSTGIFDDERRKEEFKKLKRVSLTVEGVTHKLQV